MTEKWINIYVSNNNMILTGDFYPTKQEAIDNIVWDKKETYQRTCTEKIGMFGFYVNTINLQPMKFDTYNDKLNHKGY